MFETESLARVRALLILLSSQHVFFLGSYLSTSVQDFPLIDPVEIAKCYDTNMTRQAVYKQMWSRVNPMAQAISKAREQGVNPMDIPLTAGLQEVWAKKGEALGF